MCTFNLLRASVHITIEVQFCLDLLITTMIIVSVELIMLITENNNTSDEKDCIN